MFCSPGATDDGGLAVIRDLPEASILKESPEFRVPADTREAQPEENVFVAFFFAPHEHEVADTFHGGHFLLLSKKKKKIDFFRCFVVFSQQVERKISTVWCYLILLFCL